MQLGVFTSGFTEVDHFHPGSSLNRAIVSSPIFAISSLPLSKSLRSSAPLSKFFVSIRVVRWEDIDRQLPIALILLLVLFSL
jgi:hypothetical protein